MLVRKSSNINVISKLKDSNGNATSNPIVIVNIFNKFFVNASHDISKNIPRFNKSSLSFMGGRVGNSFFTAPTVPTEISDIISLLKLSQYYFWSPPVFCPWSSSFLNLHK